MRKKKEGSKDVDALLTVGEIRLFQSNHEESITEKMGQNTIIDLKTLENY